MIASRVIVTKDSIKGGGGSKSIETALKKPRGEAGFCG
jgi:hypothetical protein